MSSCITTTPIRFLRWLLLFGLILVILPACKVIKNYPVNKPFVYKTNIKLETKLKTTDKSALRDRMLTQVDDSLQVKWVSKKMKQILDKPPVFDTDYAVKSLQYLNDLLQAVGYIYGEIKWDSSLKVKKKQQRVTTTFYVKTGAPTTFDSITYALRDSTLQTLALKSKEKQLVKKGDPYSKDKISAEIDRILSIYRNNGFMKISREDIYAEVDTVVAALIDPGLDPFEQVRLLGELQKRKENPHIDVVFKQRGTENPERLRQYHIRDVRIYPTRVMFSEAPPVYTDTIMQDGIAILTKSDLFNPAFLTKKNFLVPGALYRLDDIYRTNNVMNGLGAWQQVSIDLTPIDSIGKVDVDINMFTAKKQNLSVQLEASRNASDVITASDLFGIGLNFGLSNKNVARQSIQSNSNVRFGIELGNHGQFIQTFQISGGQNFGFSKFLIPFFKIKNENNLLTSRTMLNVNGAITDRRDYYKLQSLNGSINYDWSNRKRRSWIFSPLNVEFVRLYSTDSLEKTFAENPNLRYSLNDGLIISQKLAVLNTWSRANKILNLKIGLEECGALFGTIKALDLNGPLSRFVKADIDIRHYIDNPRNAWAFRFFAGIGIPYGDQIDTIGDKIIKEQTLPFFKSFFGGGPSSMRAWQVRQLGPGSSKIFEGTNSDRFADIMLESNIEYRFNLATVYGINLKGALFTDIGNIWYRNNQGNPDLNDAVFKFGKLYKDLAVAFGPSLRIDFTYFLIRFDWGYKIKNPIYADENAGWFQHVHLGNGQFQLGINQPF